MTAGPLSARDPVQMVCQIQKPGQFQTQENKMQRILFINRYFFPDLSATSQILSDVAFYLQTEGLNVSVITGRALYEGEAQLLPSENVNDVKVQRIATTQFGRGKLIGRALDYVSFYVSSFCAVLKHVTKGDVVIIKTDPPLLSVPLGIAIKFKGAQQINWLQDLYPETASALGVSFAKGPIGKIITILRNRSLKRAKSNVVIGHLMGDLLEKNGVSKDKIKFIPNFSDDTVVVEQPFKGRDLRKEWGLTESDFVVCYSGNLGRAHDLETMLGAAEFLKNETNIKFLFIGGGHLRKLLQEKLDQLGLNNILLQPYQPREELPQSLGVADIHWLSLKPELEALIVPSKTYGVAAAGRGLLVVGDTNGEIARAVNDGRFGYAYSIGDSQGLADRIQHLSSNMTKVRELGRNARVWLEENAKKQDVLEQWKVLLSD